jgi:hypothetical protein
MNNENYLTRIWDSLPPIADSILVNRYRTVVAGQLYWVSFFRTGNKIPKPLPGLTLEETEATLAESKLMGQFWAQLLDLCIGISSTLEGSEGPWNDPFNWWVEILIETIRSEFEGIATHVEKGSPKGALRTWMRRDLKQVRELKNFEFKAVGTNQVSTFFENAQKLAYPSAKDSPQRARQRKRFRKLHWDPFIALYSDVAKQRQELGVLLVERTAPDGRHIVKAQGQGRREQQIYPLPEVGRLKRGGRPPKNITLSGKGFQPFQQK